MAFSFSIQVQTFAAANEDEQVYVVPTFAEETEEEQVSLNGVSTQELAELKTRDSFMYYSIPQVRKAEMLYKDVDESILASEGSAQVAKRQKRLSVECHHAKLLDDQVFDSNTGGDVDSEDDGVEEDFLDSYLAQLNRQRQNRTSQQIHASNGSVDDLEENVQRFHFKDSK
jgi:hypothetical protein